jgi:hypothetical protein
VRCLGRRSFCVDKNHLDCKALGPVIVAWLLRNSTE